MADVDITITVPDAWVSRTLDALNGMAGKNIRIEFDRALKEYMYDAKDGSETNPQFAARAFREMIKQHIKAYELNEDYIRYRSDMGDILAPSESVPEDILT
jgi:hypothetical protein